MVWFELGAGTKRLRDVADIVVRGKGARVVVDLLAEPRAAGVGVVERNVEERAAPSSAEGRAPTLGLGAGVPAALVATAEPGASGGDTDGVDVDAWLGGAGSERYLLRSNVELLAPGAALKAALSCVSVVTAEELDGPGILDWAASHFATSASSKLWILTLGGFFGVTLLMRSRNLAPAVPEGRRGGGGGWGPAPVHVSVFSVTLIVLRGPKNEQRSPVRTNAGRSWKLPMVLP